MTFEERMNKALEEVRDVLKKYSVDIRAVTQFIDTQPKEEPKE